MQDRDALLLLKISFLEKENKNLQNLRKIFAF